MMETLPDDNKLAARLVARGCHKTALSTLDKGGAPYASLVTLGLDHDLSPILIISGMSAHTRNIQADSRVAFLFDGTDGHPNPQTGPRLSMQGTAHMVEGETERQRLRTRFLARNPGAVEYASFGDFSLWRVAPSRAQFVGGFGRAVWLDAPFGLSPDVIGQFQAGEAALLAKLAERGRKDVVSVDPDGYDISVGESWDRVNFTRPAPSLDDALSMIG